MITCLLLALLVIVLLFWEVIKWLWSWTWPIWIIFGIVFIANIVIAVMSTRSGSGISYDTYDSSDSDEKSRSDNLSGSYKSNAYLDYSGRSTIYTDFENDVAIHRDLFGYKVGTSERHGDTIVYKDLLGYTCGTSEIRDGGRRIDHYGGVDEGYQYKGYTEIDEYGNMTTRDAFGVIIGTTERKG